MAALYVDSILQTVMSSVCPDFWTILYTTYTVIIRYRFVYLIKHCENI
jgi:hypothetical protein